MIDIEKITPENQAKRLAAYAKLAVAAEEKKTISQKLEDIANDFCDNYCKYPEKWDEEKEGCELCESEICAECPINKLV